MQRGYISNFGFSQLRLRGLSLEKEMPECQVWKGRHLHVQRPVDFCKPPIHSMKISSDHSDFRLQGGYSYRGYIGRHRVYIVFGG